MNEAKPSVAINEAKPPPRFGCALCGVLTPYPAAEERLELDGGSSSLVCRDCVRSRWLDEFSPGGIE